MFQDEKIKYLEEENEKLKELYSKKSDIVLLSAHQIRTSLSAFLFLCLNKISLHKIIKIVYL